MPWLQWLTRDDDIKKAKVAPYRLLEPTPELSAGDPHSPNMLIQGDNLEALKALLPYYAGRVKCIYIDPPFNTGAAFEYYDDSLEHSIWLAMMYPRLELLRELLTEDGVIFVHIDDKEMAYLRTVMDEIFARSNFLNMIVVKTSDPSGHKTVNPSPYSQTEYLLMYAKNRARYKYEIQYVSSEHDPGYNRFITNRSDNHSRWNVVALAQAVAEAHGFKSPDEARKTVGKLDFQQLVADFALNHADSVFQPTAISDAAGRDIVAIRDKSKGALGKVFHVPRDGYEDIYVLNGRQIYFYSLKVKFVDGTRTPAKPLTNLWTDIPWNGIAREGGVQFKNGKKPEKLIRRCLDLTTKTGDYVLDSFLGSGTTAAVAHKMGRRYIGIELGEHAVSHCAPRLKKVIEGEQGGISEAVNWKGGGGFRFYRLGEAVFDEEGRINPKVKFAALAAHIWFTETGRPLEGSPKKPFLGVHDGIAYGLLYNGVLGDKTVNGGNVLTSALLERLKRESKGHDGPWVIYGEATRLSPERLRALRVTFKQTPYDIRAR